MSMYEAESLVELSVYALDKSEDAELDRRSLIYNLYQLQQQFDTGFTHFRVMDILIKYHYVYTFPITSHPEYAKHKPWFDRLAAEKKFSFIFLSPLEAYDTDNNPVAGYANYDHTTQQYILYCDAGSILWEQMVANGTITGNDAIAPEEMNIFSVAHEIAELAGEQKDITLLGNWYQLLPYIVMMEDQEGNPINYKALEAILDIIVANDAINAETLPPADELPVGGELGKFCQWWYAAAGDKMKPTAEEEKEEEIDLETIPFTEQVEKSTAWYEQQVIHFLQTANNEIAELEEKGGDENAQARIYDLLQQGLTFAQKGLELSPNEPNLLMNQGSLYMLAGLLDKALASYDAALAVAPDNPNIHLNRAILFWQNDQLPEAIKSFEKVTELDPTNEFALQWLEMARKG
ncbi:tetratricopeptide repeat protein [Chitinophaga silvatica]|nr:tetratricopeptide repeat protein [Chitinophaga silvatica]